jgi:DUF2971 family protein
VRAYKYLPSEFALKTIVERRIKISELADMNDPLELWGVSLSDPEVHQFLANLADEKWGALCLSSERNNPLLWSHYADKHKGLCLGFEIGPDEELVRLDYVETRETASVEAFKQLASTRHMRGSQTPGARNKAKEPVMRMLSTKFKKWEYENEVRLFASKEVKECGICFHPFDERFKLCEVIVGARCCVQRATIEAWLTGYDDVKVIKLRLADASFELVEDSSFVL